MTVGAPAAFACTGANITCPHAYFDMYGSHLWNTGSVRHYAFGWSYQNNLGRVDRTQDAVGRWNAITGSPLTFGINTVSDRYLTTNGVNGVQSANNPCNPDFNWGDVAGAQVVFLYDQNFVSEGGASSAWAVTGFADCNGTLRVVVTVNGDSHTWAASDAECGSTNCPDADLEGIMTHEFGHVTGFGTSGGAGCNLGSYICHYGAGEWPESTDGGSVSVCDTQGPSLLADGRPTMCPLWIGYHSTFNARTIEHDDNAEFSAAY